MSRLRIYPGDDGDAERDREAQWASLPPTLLCVHGPGDNPNEPYSRTGFAFLHLRCNCRTRRDHGFDRCNRHVTLRDHQRGYRFCIQCRTHCDVTEATSFEAAMQMRRNWRRMRPDTPLTPEEADFYTGRIFRDGLRDAPKTATATVQGVLGPNLLERLLWSAWSHPLSGYDDRSCCMYNHGRHPAIVLLCRGR